MCMDDGLVHKLHKIRSFKRMVNSPLCSNVTSVHTYIKGLRNINLFQTYLIYIIWFSGPS
jgi:hypothetical protein